MYVIRFFFVILGIISFQRDTSVDSCLTQTSWIGGSPYRWSYVEEWSDMFYSSSGIDWSSNPGNLTILNGYERVRLDHNDEISITSFTPSDIDSDGDTDLFILFRPSGLGWLENPSSTDEWIFHEIPHHIYSPKAHISVDFDDNSFPDLAVTSREDGLLIVFQTASDQWEIENVDREFYSGWDLEIADLNEDGFCDIIGSSRVPSYICWWENPGSQDAQWDSYLISDSYGPRGSITIVDTGEFHKPVLYAIENGICGLTVLRQGIDCTEPWTEVLLGEWMEKVNFASVFTRINSDGQRYFCGMVISKQDGYPFTEDSYLMLNSHYEFRDTLPLEYSYSFCEFILTGDIDGDGDLDICFNTYCFENRTYWLPHRYLDVPTARSEDWDYERASNPMCIDLDGNGSEELVLELSGSIWYVDHSQLKSRGELVSDFFEPEELNQWKSLSWEADEPLGTSVSMYFRYNQYSDWIGPFTEPINLTEYESDSINQFQYKVILESANSNVSPVLHSVTVEWN